MLGMHRSGTSAISGVLNIMRADFGKNMIPASYDNPKGFYENEEILKLNEKIFADFGFSWDYPSYLDSEWLDSAIAKKHMPRAIEILQKEFGKSSLIAIKDPRLCHLFPFWKQCIEKLGYKIHCILTWRHPRAVAQSLKRRNNLTENHSHLLITSYFTEAERSTRSESRLFIQYEQLLESPDSIQKLIVKECGIKVDSSVSSDVKKFISRKLQHNSAKLYPSYNGQIKHISEIYAVLDDITQRYRTTTKQEKALDKYRILHEGLTNTFYSGVLGQKKFFCKIFIDSGKGFNEGETTSFYITDKLHSWDISGLSKYGPINKIRILPINAPAKVVLEYLGVDDDEEKNYSIKSNAYFSEESTYYFDSPHSEILINFDNSYIAEKLVITLKYPVIGEAMIGAIKDLDYGRMLRAKDLELESKSSIISERDRHLQTKEGDLLELEKIIKSYKKSLENEKKESEKVVASLKSAVEAEKKETEKIKASLNKALSTEKGEAEKLKESMLKAINAEKLEATKIKNEVTASMQKAIDAEKKEAQKLKESLQKAVEAEKKETLKLKDSLQKALNAERAEQAKLKETMLKAINAEKLEASRLIAKGQEQLSAEREKSRLALEAERYDKAAVKESLMNAIVAEKEDKEVIRASLLERLNAELANERKIRDERIGEATGLLYSEIKDKEDKINTLQATVIHEINERHKVVSSLKEERERVVGELINNINHEIREKERAVLRLQQALRHEKAEQVRMFTELSDSFSFKLGWFLTSPLRVAYNFFAGLKTGKIGMAFSMAGLAMRNPGKTLRNLNAEKLRTLQSALKRESPQTISSNFNKLLNADKVKAANDSAQVAQKTIFEKASVTSSSIQNKKLSPNFEIKDGVVVETDFGKTVHAESTLSEAIVEEQGQAAGLKVQSKKILFISPNIPDFDTSSGGKRATRMLGLLAEENEVYAYARGARQQKYIDKLASVGVTFLEEYDYEVIKSQIPHLDVIIYAWYYTYHESIRFKELYPNAKLIMDSVDIHWVREERSIGLMKGLTKKKAAENKKSEISAYKGGDLIWAVTEPDRQAVLKEIPDADVRVVSNIHETALDEFRPCKQNNILFFGGYNHYPNISAVKLIAEQILPAIRKEVPDAGLLIAGANAPQEVIDLGNKEGVTYLGFIKEEDVTKLYDSCKVTIAPLLAGAGIKGKICEAIAFMTPIITNAIGNEGIALADGVDGFVTEDFSQMAQRAIECMQGKHDLASMTDRAQHKLHSIVGPEIVKKNMIDSLHREVSICIVTWNRLELLKPCIESIIENTRYPHYKILVHSNGCEDGTKEYLIEASEKDSRIIPILSDKNDVFVIPNNQMADRYPHNDVVLINNDVTVEENWLQALVDAAYSSRKIGISGSKILYPDGTLQEFGSELYANGSGRNIGKWDKDPYKEEYGRITAVGYVSGCSLFIKRETLKKTGLFDMDFHPCYCEDSDLCYSAWKKDIYTVVTPHSIINHFEGGTSGKDEDSGFKSYQKVNFDKFLAKHKEDLNHIADKISAVNKDLHQ